MLHLTPCNCSLLLKWIALLSPQPSPYASVNFLISNLVDCSATESDQQLKEQKAIRLLWKTLNIFFWPRKLEWLSHSCMVEVWCREGQGWDQTLQCQHTVTPDCADSSLVFYNIILLVSCSHFWVYKYCRQVDITKFVGKWIVDVLKSYKSFLRATLKMLLILILKIDYPTVKITVHIFKRISS